MYRTDARNRAPRADNSRFKSKKCLVEAGTEFTVAFRKEASRKLKTSKKRGEILKLIEQTAAISKDDLVNGINQMKTTRLMPSSELERLNRALISISKLL